MKPRWEKNANRQNHTLQQLEIGSGLIETNPDGLIPTSFEAKIVENITRHSKGNVKLLAQ